MKYKKDSFGSSQGNIILPPGLVGTGPSNGKGFDRAARQKAAMDILKNYQTIELPEDKLDGMEEDFMKWGNDDSYLEDYSNFSILQEDKVLIRLYRYEAPLSSVLFNEEGEQGIMGVKILPYVKVIKAHPNNHSKIKPGDILCVTENIGKFITNQAWIEWKVLKEQEGTQIPEPPQMTGLLTEWRGNMVRKQACKLDPDDNYTFVLSDREFKAAYKKN